MQCKVIDRKLLNSIRYEYLKLIKFQTAISSDIPCVSFSFSFCQKIDRTNSNAIYQRPSTIRVGLFCMGSKLKYMYAHIWFLLKNEKKIKVIHQLQTRERNRRNRPDMKSKVKNYANEQHIFYLKALGSCEMEQNSKLK